MNNATLSETEYRVLTDACACPAGAANYLHTKAIARLTSLGLVAERTEHSVKATPRGHEVWHARGAL